MTRKCDQAISLAKQGHPPADIAVQTGLAVNSVYHYLNVARRAGDDIPPFKTGPRLGQVVSIDAATARALRPHANLRMCSTDDLARAILQEATRRNLVDMILDDEVARYG